MTDHAAGPYQRITLIKEASTATVTLNRPPANAVDMGVLNEIGHALDDIEADREIRSVIFTGAGDRMFCGGADISEFSKMSPDQRHLYITSGCDLYDRIEAFAKPTIAAINGFALGGGNELAMSCDIRIAAARARFGLPEIKLGLLPGWGGIQRLTRLVGQTKARELLLTGGMVDATEAKAAGLVNRVVPDAELMKEARAMAGVLGQQAPLAVAEIKRLLVGMDAAPLRECIRDSAAAFEKLIMSKDGAEGVAAFLQKRAPTFKGE